MWSWERPDSDKIKGMLAKSSGEPPLKELYVSSKIMKIIKENEAESGEPFLLGTPVVECRALPDNQMVKVYERFNPCLKEIEISDPPGFLGKGGEKENESQGLEN